MVTRELARAVGAVEVNDGGGIERAIVVDGGKEIRRSRVQNRVLFKTTMTESAPTPAKKKLKPARKQVKPGDVEKKETPQTGKEYSAFLLIRFLALFSAVRRHLVQ